MTMPLQLGSQLITEDLCHERAVVVTRGNATEDPILLGPVCVIHGSIHRSPKGMGASGPWLAILMDAHTVMFVRNPHADWHGLSYRNSTR